MDEGGRNGFGRRLDSVMELPFRGYEICSTCEEMKIIW
jgi:hypothetical protein